jgi:hypothetical protein
MKSFQNKIRIMKSTVLFFFTLLVAMPLLNTQIKAQPTTSWMRTVDGNGNKDVIKDITVDDNGNIYAVGYTVRTSSEYDYLILKYSSAGVRLSADTLDPGLKDEAFSVSYKGGTYMGNLYVTGTQSVGGSERLVTYRFDTTSLGDTLRHANSVPGHSNYWFKKTFSNSTHDIQGVKAMAATGDVVYILGRDITSTSAADVVVVKYTTLDADAVSSATLNPGGYDYAVDLTLDASNNVYFIGLTDNTSSWDDKMFIYKYNSSLSATWGPITHGSVVCDRTNGYGQFYNILVDTSGYVYCAAQRHLGNPSTDSIKVVILNASDGSLKSIKGKVNSSYDARIAVYNPTKTVVVANTCFWGGDVVKYTNSGGSWSELWSNTFYRGYRTFLDNSENVYISGEYNNDFILSKFNSSSPGTKAWDYSVDGYYGGGLDGFGDAFATTSGDIYIGGSSQMSLYLTDPAEYDAALLKLSVGGNFPAQATKSALSENIITNLKGIPNRYELYQNYPNPFNPVTSIKFSLKETGYISLKLYDVAGQDVKTLIDNKEYENGEHEINVDASQLSSGIYFYRLSANDGKFIETKKMVLIK